MDTSDFTVDMVTDNQDNSLTITGHDSDDNSYTTSMGRKTDMPDSGDFSDSDNIEYYQDILAQYAVPPTPTVVYQAPGYTPPEDNSSQENGDES